MWLSFRPSNDVISNYILPEIFVSRKAHYVLKPTNNSNYAIICTLVKVVEIRMASTFRNQPIHSAFNKAALKCVGLEVFDVVFIRKLAIPCRHIQPSHLRRTLGYHGSYLDGEGWCDFLSHVYAFAGFWRSQWMMNHNLDRWQDSLKHEKLDALRI